MGDTGDIIRKRRIELGMTQEELGDKLGLQKSAIAKYENGRVENLKRSTIQKLAEVLEVSPSYLMGWEDAEESPQYYTDPEVAQMAQEIFENSGLRILFDASRKLTKEDLETVVKIAKRMQVPEGDDGL